MSKLLARFAAIGAALGAALAVQAADLTVRLDAREVARKRIHTELTLAVKPGPLTLVYAKWIPGEHAPSGPLESLIGLEIRARGAALPWTRDPYDMYALRVTVPSGVDSLVISIETGLAAEPNAFTAGPTSSAQLAILPWNQFLLFPKGVDAERLTAVATVLPPAGWLLVCPLDATPVGGGGYQLEPASVARLIDSPVQMGRYAERIELAGSGPAPELKHTLSIMADSAAALEVPPEFAQGYSRLVAETGALFGSRIYRHYTWLLSLSDHVQHFGLEHHESSDDRVNLAALGDQDGRMSVARLLAHEYVHSWNGKYRRPQGLLSPDYQQPMDGSLLWVYEGMTQFWEEVLPARAGLVTEDYAREVIAELGARFDFAPGSRWRPMADTAVAAQVLFPAPETWATSRRGVDFYDASIFLWLDVDAELREQSQGRVSLDDFTRSFYSGVSGTPQLKPYLERDLYATLSQLAAADWRTLIRRHLDPPSPAALFAALERRGWRLVYTGAPNARGSYVDKREKQTTRLASIGLGLDKDANITDVVETRAAARAGAAPGMQLVAVNGRKYSAEVLDRAILEAQSNRQPISLLVLGDDDYRTLSVEYYDGPRFPHLLRIDGRPDTLTPLFKARVPVAAH